MAVILCGDAPEVFQAAEHALDGVSVAVEHGREAVLPEPVGAGRDVRHGAHALDLSADRIAIVALVTMEDAGTGHLAQQNRSSGAICDLSAGQQECDRSAVAVCQRMDFGRAPAPRAADRLTALPPFPPEAER